MVHKKIQSNLQQYSANNITNNIFFVIRNMKKVVIQKGGEKKAKQILGSQVHYLLFSITTPTTG
jgi:hypothetical protein